MELLCGALGEVGLEDILECSQYLDILEFLNIQNILRISYLAVWDNISMLGYSDAGSTRATNLQC